jgi:threonine synthase
MTESRTAAPTPPWTGRPRLMERYARFLPVTEATPALTLGEGDTPLVHAPRLGPRSSRTCT